MGDGQIYVFGQENGISLRQNVYKYMYINTVLVIESQGVFGVGESRATLKLWFRGYF